MKIMLIATGSETITELMAQAFQNEYSVYTCNRGNDSLQMLQEIQPDVLIIHLSLPDITGLEVLKQTSYTPPVIIALTGFIDDSIVQEAQRLGVRSLLRLPCSVQSISAQIKRLLT